jgi:SAM-dependent methyltransferase
MTTDPRTQFSSKAQGYQDHRWDYAPAAIETLIGQTHLGDKAVIADIGAGTGMVSRHFIERGYQVFAVEPNLAMRQMAEQALGHDPAFHTIDGLADATTLAKQSVDLIVVGRAIHWFSPVSTRDEFLRILKPTGWLAILRTPVTASPLKTAIDTMRTAENGCIEALHKQRIESTPLNFYYGNDDFLFWNFPATTQEGWEQLLGRITSFSSTPSEADPLYPQFKAALRAVFDHFSVDGQVTVDFSTELFLGQITSNIAS